MRNCSKAVLAAALALSSGAAWSLIPSPATFTHRRHTSFGVSQRRRDTVLMSVVPQKKDELSTETQGSSAEKIANELSKGVTLDGGPVIDFASVKDSTSRAEIALLDARKKYEATLDKGSNEVPTSRSSAGERLMGINDDVVAEVGYEIGVFVDEYVDAASGETADELVQKCARYIRSKASLDTFPQSWKVSGNGEAFTADEISRFDLLLARAYDESGIVTAAFAKTFYLGTQVLPEPSMKAIWAVYVWCRRTDEIVDAPRPEAQDPNGEMLTDLSEWEIRLERLFDRGDVVDVLDLPLLDCKVKYPKLPITPFSDMVRGMLMDIPGLGQERYETWDELHLYCYRVAGTVGLMSMPVFGCAPGYTPEIAKEPALSLGVAFQITNILRDIGEDAETRERVYLPQCDLKQFGVTEQQLMDKIVDENYINLMKFEIARARMYYARALRGVAMLRPESRLPVQLSLDAYGKILTKIEENGYDTLTKRAYVGKWEKLAGIPSSWYRTLDVANILPLPEDWGKPTLDVYEKELKDMYEKIWEEQSK
mmetsp:Transcript_11417/g.21087  ORF Transcript_11417/g.21087 Transcript_11417/m.21087 type:complete len:540 (+) Transcript_11417:190-1809(+)|eukprot:CAMPEP_0201885032 /NCGR_PEP_ID=MMETSP0902-20130614/17682_1 /ASSEMBLY_ACC=CAM_ASM_000551 /TAXON_ID=420261 /ORGANISM="Thalassiosira antarctica, Strain CCMP982" /LENGTH=539 /DNA_ID=CAMNT_0048414055 /DNA_START=68 /DNA_END=1687 /DNA_ORIENTATION=+